MGQMFAKAKNEDGMVRPLQPNMHVGRGLQLKAVSHYYSLLLRPLLLSTRGATHHTIA